MTYDFDNRLATFNGNHVTNDLDGNMIYGPGTNSTFVSYSYDARNRLRSSGGLSYAYDPAGDRVAITNGGSVTRFIVNANATLSQVLVRTKADGSKTLYVYGLGLLYEVNETSGGSETSTRFYHYDLRGSTVALTAGNGNPTDYIQYSSHGTITFRAGTTDTPFLYNGRYGVQTDANGLLYMRARYYNPYLCRFLNPDPVGFAGGLNFFAYADGDPISLLDPFGLGAREPSNIDSWFDISPYPTFDPLQPSLFEQLNPVSSSGFSSGTLRPPEKNPFTYDALLPGARHLVGTPAGEELALQNAVNYLTAPGFGIAGEFLSPAVSTTVTVVRDSRIALQEPLLVAVQNGQVVASAPVVGMSHAEFVRQALRITGKELPPGLWVGTAGRSGQGPIVGLNSQTFFQNQAPANPAIQNALRAHFR